MYNIFLNVLQELTTKGKQPLDGYKHISFFEKK